MKVPVNNQVRMPLYNCNSAQCVFTVNKSVATWSVYEIERSSEVNRKSAVTVKSVNGK